MKVIETAHEKPEALSAQEREWVYNGMDCAVTAEVLEVLLPQIDNHTASTYRFSLDLQAPVLEMRVRGVRIDLARREEVIEEYDDKLDRLQTQLEKIVGDGCGFYDFNWRSNKHLHELFYDRLGIPAVIRGGVLALIVTL
jgi:DNA polymerase I-like protein with 3'-5' exonuclease and polymerase domains